MTVRENPGSWTASEVDPATTADPAFLGLAGSLPLDAVETGNIADSVRWYRTGPVRLLGQASVVVGAAMLVGLAVFFVVRQLAASDVGDETLRGGPVNTLAIQPGPGGEEAAQPNSSRSGSRRSEADRDSPGVLPLADGDGNGNGDGNDGSTRSADGSVGGTADTGPPERPASRQGVLRNGVDAGQMPSNGVAPPTTSGITILNASTATTGGPNSTTTAAASSSSSRTPSPTGRTGSTVDRTTSVTSVSSVISVSRSTTTLFGAATASGGTTTVTPTTTGSTALPTTSSTAKPSTTATPAPTGSTSSTTTAPPLPAELISLPADGSVHRWDAVTTVRANRVPGATSYCWSATAGTNASRCQADRDFELASGQLQPGPTTIRIEAIGAGGTVLMAQQISISRLVGDLIDQPGDGASFAPDDRIRLRVKDISGADDYCWVVSQGSYSSGELCSDTGSRMLTPGHIVRRTLEGGSVTLQARAYRGTVLIARQTITISVAVG